jgi:hypothetical protein
LLNQLSKEFYLSDQEKLLIVKGIRQGLERFYKERDGKAELLTERNYLSRQRSSYVYDSLYHLTNQHPELNVTAEIRNAGLSYKYVLLVFEDRNIMLTVSQVNQKEDLPEYSEYRSEFAEGNGIYNQQLSFFKHEAPYKARIYKHLIVTYNGSHGPVPDFIWIGATTPEQDSWIYHQNLTEGLRSDVLQQDNLSVQEATTDPAKAKPAFKETLLTSVSYGNAMKAKPTLKKDLQKKIVTD